MTTKESLEEQRGRASDAVQFLRFLLVGGLNTLVGYALFAIFILVGAGITFSLVGATVLGVMFNFRSLGSLVFIRTERRLLPRFVLVYAGQFAINWLSLRYLQALGVTPLFAQLMILPPLSIVSFLAMRRWVFIATAKV